MNAKAKNAGAKHNPDFPDSQPPQPAESDQESPAPDTIASSDTAPAQPVEDNVEILNKIVAKDIVPKSALTYRKQVRKDANGHALKNADGTELMEVVNPEPRLLYRIFGTVRDVQHGDSTYGQWTAFVGGFEAIRLSDRARFQAPKAFLQGASEGLLLDAFKALVAKDPAASLSFAFDIGVKASDRWISEDKGNSYEYTVKTVFNTNKHDPLKELREAAMRSLPALPAPAAK
jgi:hypothetical protein